MQEQQLIVGATYDYQATQVVVRKVTDSTVFFNLKSAPDDKPLYVRKNTFLSRAELSITSGTVTGRFSCATPNFTEVPRNEVTEKVFVAGRQCGKRTMVAELTEKWAKKFKKDLRYGSRKAKNEARRALGD